MNVDLQKVYALDRQVQETVRQLRDNGAEEMMPLFYRKAIVMFASRYLALGAVQDAMSLLARIPAEFYRDDLPNLMQTDPDFAQVAARVADAMVSNGIVEPEYLHDPRHEIQPGVAIA